MIKNKKNGIKIFFRRAVQVNNHQNKCKQMSPFLK